MAVEGSTSAKKLDISLQDLKEAIPFTDQFDLYDLILSTTSLCSARLQSEFFEQHRHLESYDKLHLRDRKLYTPSFARLMSHRHLLFRL